MRDLQGDVRERYLLRAVTGLWGLQDRRSWRARDSGGGWWRLLPVPPAVLTIGAALSIGTARTTLTIGTARTALTIRDRAVAGSQILMLNLMLIHILILMLMLIHILMLNLMLIHILILMLMLNYMLMLIDILMLDLILILGLWGRQGRRRGRELRVDAEI